MARVAFGLFVIACNCSTAPGLVKTLCWTDNGMQASAEAVGSGITAPTRQPTIEETLRSVQRARAARLNGFGGVGLANRGFGFHPFTHRRVRRCPPREAFRDDLRFADHGEEEFRRVTASDSLERVKPSNR